MLPNLRLNNPLRTKFIPLLNLAKNFKDEEAARTLIKDN